MDQVKKIIIVDDSKHFRAGLASIINSIGGTKNVRQASSGCEMLAMLDKELADIVFIDIKMPGLSGIETTQIAHQRYPELIIIGFSSMENPGYIKNLINAGASGYLSKNKDNYNLIKHIIENKISRNIYSEGLEITNLIENHKLNTYSHE